MATPTLVQHVVWVGSGNGDTNGNTFILRLPNATLANNCLALFCQYPSSISTITITDNATGGTNTWSGTPTKTVTDAGNGMTNSVFILPGAFAGVTVFTVVFNTAIQGFKPTFQEWYNVATSSPLDGSNAAVATSSPIQSGSFNTTVDGDLILQWACSTDNGSAGLNGHLNGLSLVGKQSTYTLAQVDLVDGYFSQYLVQTTHGATNPGGTLTQTASPFTYPSLTIALKSATSGTAPSPTAHRVFGLNHNRVIGTGAAGNLTYPVQFPTVGNTFLATCSDPFNAIVLVGVSGAVSGAWATVTTAGIDAQACHKESGTPSTDELLTFTLNDTIGHQYIQGFLYDVVNGGAFDISVIHNDGATFGPGNSSASTLTPGVTNGMVVAVAGLGTGPPDSIVTPAGAVFLCSNYTGMSDLSYMDNGDFHGIYFYSSNAAQNWVFHNTASTSGYSALLISIAAGSAPPPPPLPVPPQGPMPRQLYVMP